MQYLKKLLYRLRVLLNKKDKIFLILLIFFSIAVSLMETMAVAVIPPFIAIAGDHGLITGHPLVSNFFRITGFSNPVNFVMFLGVGLIVFYAVRCLINLAYFYWISKFSYGRYHLFATRLFSHYLKLDLRNLFKKGTPHITKLIVTDANNLTQSFYFLLLIFSEVLVSVFLYSFLIFINWKLTLGLTFLFLIVIFTLIKWITGLTKDYAEERNQSQGLFYSLIVNTFQNLKFIKVVGVQSKLNDWFEANSFKMSKVNTFFNMLMSSQKPVLEAFGFIVLLGMVMVITWQSISPQKILPLISVYALAFMRFLPSFNRILQGWQQLVYYSNSVDFVYQELQEETVLLGEASIDMQKNIVLEQVSFGYQENLILKGLNLTILRGERIGLIGSSGGGKSTLLDLLMGIYLPQAGSIKIDGVALSLENIKSWQQKIGYIPQSIFLMDGTLRDNVVFFREYDESKLVDALKKAKIYDFIMTREGLDTRLGEDGILLSGGQKQRIAIARALYGNPEVLILDEATSALDEQTESAIMQEIYALSSDLTLIIVAHRQSVLKGCSKIYKIDQAKLVE